MRISSKVCASLLIACSVLGCPKPSTGGGSNDSIEPPQDPRLEGIVPPSNAALAGTSCRGRDDCASDQVCMQNTCRARRASAAGEILAASARAQLEAGDLVGALQSFDQSLERFRALNAQPPPEVVCGAASAALRGAASPEDRENAVKRADSCFRNSLPGDPSRSDVRLGLARLRYDGLDLTLFDRPEPAPRFFTQPPTRPTIDAIEISFELPERDDPGYVALTTALRDEGATRAVSGCFIADWESRHERTAEAQLTLKYSTRMHDRGSYDSFDPLVEVVATVPVDNLFTNCLAENLTAALGPGPRVNHLVSWQETFVLAARVQ
ncbi:MAG: hypothetical protein IPK60_25345 [Sandaracinaceae bacterium]|nr:hypothetical protein [Sandaracinaceae bacterium]